MIDDEVVRPKHYYISAVRKMLETTDLNVKNRDFEYLLFDKSVRRMHRE